MPTTAQGVLPCPIIASHTHTLTCTHTHTPQPSPLTHSIMAHDCLAVLDDLHWHHNVHIVGHSMGGMIGVKLAALAPHRVASLTVISTSAGGWDALLPRSWRQFKMGWKMMMARDEDTRTKRTLKAHFTKEMLDELVCVGVYVVCVCERES